MAKINREDIHIISRHSNWSADGVARELKEKVYNDIQSWQQFLRLFFVSLGIGFTASGVVFFFAYNWADLHKFAKLGIAEGLVLAAIAIVLFSRLSQHLKNIILTGASVLVGVLFAVFGQIYQTGANAYDFFLGWTLFISLWALVSNFPALWLLLLILINTTFILYAQQLAHGWSEVFVLSLLFTFNTTILTLLIWLSRGREVVKVPTWFTHTIALAAITFSTMGIAMGIFDDFQRAHTALIFIAAIFYGLGIKYGLKWKSGFYLSLIPFSTIIIISAFLVRVSDGAGMLLIVSVFVVGSVTLVIRYLIGIQKRWING